MLHNNKHCTLLLYIFHQLKPPLLLYVRVLFVIYLGQKHPLLPNPKRIVPVKPAVNHIFFLGFRMKSHIFNDVILVLKMLIYSVDFYFAFFHYIVSSFSNIFIFHGTAYTSFRCHIDTDHFCQPLGFAENSFLQVPLEMGLYLDYSVCIPAGSDLLNP